MSNGKSSWQESPSSMGDRGEENTAERSMLALMPSAFTSQLCRSLADSTNRAVRSRKRHHTHRTQRGRVGVDTEHYSLGASRQHGDLSRYHRAVQTGPGAPSGNHESFLAHHPQVRVRSQCGTESYSIFDCFRTFRVDNDKTESFAFTEVGQIIAGGLGANGAMWHRRYDRTGVAMVSNAISKNHQPYLADGGYGFPVGRRRFELRTLKHRPT